MGGEHRPPRHDRPHFLPLQRVPDQRPLSKRAVGAKFRGLLQHSSPARRVLNFIWPFCLVLFVWSFLSGPFCVVLFVLSFFVWVECRGHTDPVKSSTMVAKLYRSHAGRKHSEGRQSVVHV